MFVLFVLYKDKYPGMSYGANGKKLQHYSADMTEDKPETIGNMTKRCIIGSIWPLLTTKYVQCRNK
jgi:hypothetical protein